MIKLFERIFWHNNTTPAIDEDNLNAMSKAIDDIDDRVIELGDDVLVVVPQIQAYLEQAEDLVEAMENLSKYPPYIGDNGDWYVWDIEQNQYVDSGIDASITVTIADVTMIASGSSPYVTNTGTDTDPIFHLFIPMAATPVISATATVDSNVGTPSVTVTKSGTLENPSFAFSFSNLKGADGQGSGDMTASTYDPQGTVANDGGITAYVADQLSPINNALANKADASALNDKEDVPTVLTSTLAASATSITFTDDSIGSNSRIRAYSNPFVLGLITNMTQSSTSVTLTCEPQSSSVSIKLEVRN